MKLLNDYPVSYAIYMINIVFNFVNSLIISWNRLLGIEFANVLLSL